MCVCVYACVRVCVCVREREREGERERENARNCTSTVLDLIIVGVTETSMYSYAAASANSTAIVQQTQKLFLSLLLNGTYTSYLHVTVLVVSVPLGLWHDLWRQTRFVGPWRGGSVQSRSL